ncbi:MAG TPA: aminotransferase class I/II-fold pyridoxal phosphate-dependent enzyme, partial [Acidimicrobiales bacterium]|nr:aminotransferase class I/II-fold pyridoxal phosphate-dependent enzyme [Acidimicrobiales bacterium]
DPPPPVVVEALARAAGLRGYPPSAGTPELREAAAGWLARRLSVEVPASDVAACVGTKEFVASLAHYLSLRDPTRDTVLYPAVSYPTYAMGAALAGLRAVPVPWGDAGLDLAAVGEDDARRALLLWVNSPSNPTGALDDLAAAAHWGRERGVVVASDECYVAYTWAGGARTILSSGTEGVLAVHSASKRSNMAGARVGVYAGDPGLVGYLRAVRQHAGLMAAGPLQAAAAAAFSDDEHVQVQRAVYRGRLLLVSEALRAAGVDAPMPAGTFYLWARRGGMDGWALAQWLAEASGIVASPGELNGEAGSDLVRVAVVQPDERLALAASRLVATPTPTIGR